MVSHASRRAQDMRRDATRRDVTQQHASGNQRRRAARVSSSSGLFTTDINEDGDRRSSALVPACAHVRSSTGSRTSPEAFNEAIFFSRCYPTPRRCLAGGPGKRTGG